MIRHGKQWTDYLATRDIQPALVNSSDIPEQPKRRRTGAAKRQEAPERDIQRAILTALQNHPLVAHIERLNVMAGQLVQPNGTVSRFMRSCRKGRVDLDGFMTDARVIAIEVKRPSTRNEVSQEQREYLAKVTAAGGIAGVATSVEEAIAIVEGRI